MSGNAGNDKQACSSTANGRVHKKTMSKVESSRNKENKIVRPKSKLVISQSITTPKSAIPAPSTIPHIPWEPTPKPIAPLLPLSWFCVDELVLLPELEDPPVEEEPDPVPEDDEEDEVLVLLLEPPELVEVPELAAVGSFASVAQVPPICHCSKSKRKEKWSQKGYLKDNIYRKDNADSWICLLNLNVPLVVVLGSYGKKATFPSEVSWTRAFVEALYDAKGSITGGPARVFVVFVWYPKNVSSWKTNVW